MTNKKCPQCGAELDENATRCYNCQCWLTQTENVVDESIPQDHLSTLLFAYFLGLFGIHRFWTGYYAIGTVQLLTLGGCGIWTIIDVVSLCFNKYKDAQGRALRDYNPSIGIVLFVLMLIPLILIIFFITIFAGLAVIGTGH